MLSPEYLRKILLANYYKMGLICKIQHYCLKSCASQLAFGSCMALMLSKFLCLLYVSSCPCWYEKALTFEFILSNFNEEGLSKLYWDLKQPSGSPGELRSVLKAFLFLSQLIMCPLGREGALYSFPKLSIITLNWVMKTLSPFRLWLLHHNK